MDVDKGTYTYTDYDGKKHKVSIERVHKLSQLHKGDHIAFERLPYWHHAIVEDTDAEKGCINVIEYSNTAKGFSREKSGNPSAGKAKVRRSSNELESNGPYLIKHTKCLDAGSVVSRARCSLGERKYNVFTNNCEHFALWCKTDISSSEQVKKVQEIVKDRAYMGTASMAIMIATNTASHGGEKIVTTAVREMTKEYVTKTVTKGGQEIMKTGVKVAAKHAVTQTVSKGGQEIMKTGVEVATKQVVTQTVSKGGQEIVKAGVEAAAQTISNSGQEIVKTSLVKASKEVVSQSVTQGGRDIAITGSRVTTKEVFTRTATKAGEKIVTKGARETTTEVTTHTSTSTGPGVGESVIKGVAVAAAFECVSVGYHIYCAHKSKKAGKMSQEEFDKAVGERIVGGVSSIGSTTGAVIGQVLIPVPILGGLVGRWVGGWTAQKLTGN